MAAAATAPAALALVLSTAAAARVLAPAAAVRAAMRADRAAARSRRAETCEVGGAEKEAARRVEDGQAVAGPGRAGESRASILERIALQKGPLSRRVCATKEAWACGG